jgi:hypothetical protein
MNSEAEIKTLITLRQNNDFSFITTNDGKKYCVQLTVNFDEPEKTNFILVELTKE